MSNFLTLTCFLAAVSLFVACDQKKQETPAGRPTASAPANPESGQNTSPKSTDKAPENQPQTAQEASKQKKVPDQAQPPAPEASSGSPAAASSPNGSGSGSTPENAGGSAPAANSPAANVPAANNPADSQATAPEIAAICVNCHNENIQSNSNTPKLAGMDKEYFKKQVQAYKDETRKYPSAKSMTSFVSELKQDQIEELANYFSSLKIKKYEIKDDTIVAKGKELYESKGCKGCHGANGEGVPNSGISLASQNPKYVSQQLKLYKKGERKDPTMQEMAAALDKDDDINAVAAYISSLTGEAQK